MTTFYISKWFEIEAEDIEQAYEIAGEIGKLAEESEDIPCFDSGDINVEEACE